MGLAFSRKGSKVPMTASSEVSVMLFTKFVISYFSFLTFHLPSPVGYKLTVIFPLTVRKHKTMLIEQDNECN
jgi:hypothetical protein